MTHTIQEWQCSSVAPVPKSFTCSFNIKHDSWAYTNQHSNYSEKNSMPVHFKRDGNCDVLLQKHIVPQDGSVDS